MTRSDDAARIARGLTPIQAQWLDHAWYGRNGWRTYYRPKLHELGLCQPKSSLLTPLGLAVRQALKGTTDEQ